MSVFTIVVCCVCLPLVCCEWLTAIDALNLSQFIGFFFFLVFWFLLLSLLFLLLLVVVVVLLLLWKFSFCNLNFSKTYILELTSDLQQSSCLNLSTGITSVSYQVQILALFELSFLSDMTAATTSLYFFFIYNSYFHSFISNLCTSLEIRGFVRAYTCAV